jgi:hypothetical protein
MRSPIRQERSKGKRKPYSIRINELNRIKQMIEDKYTLYAIANEFGLAYGTISRIKIKFQL